MSDQDKLVDAEGNELVIVKRSQWEELHRVLMDAKQQMAALWKKTKKEDRTRAALWSASMKRIDELEWQVGQSVTRIMELEDELRHYRDPANPAFYQIRWDRQPKLLDTPEA